MGYNPNWVELYNNEDSSINLNGFCLFINNKNKVKLNSVVIPAKSYLVFNFSPNQSDYNLPIIINKFNGVLFLKDPNKKQVDKLEYSNLPDGKSFGRIPDGGNELIYFNTPTPMLSNYTFLMPNKPPIIKDVSFYPTNPLPFQEVTVTAFIFDDYALTSAKLFYNDDNIAEYESDFINKSCDPRKVEAKIKGFPPMTNVSFYIKVSDDSSAISFYPDGAPAVNINYIVGEKK